MTEQKDGKRVLEKNDNGTLGHRRRLLLAAVFLCAGVLGALSLGALAHQPGPSAAVSAPTDAVLPPSTASAIPSAAPEPTPVPAPALDFSLPAPETGAVEDDWFSDAVFLGDSRSDGLRLYSGIRGADFLAYKSLMVFQVTGTGGVDAKAIPKNGVGDKKTALAWLEEKQYGKVYVMFGINELGYGDDQAFQDAFALLIDEIRVRQPEAVIYIQSLIPVEPEKAHQMNPAVWLNNENVANYNESLRRVCADKRAVYVDVQSVMADDSGTLPAEGTTDGIHFTRSWYEKWYGYLKTHTVDPEAYRAGQGQAEGTEA